MSDSLIPTVFLPLSLLSYTSVLGILSTILVVIVILVDGVSKTESPGSLWSPADTSFGIDNWNHLGIAFGLFMAGFSGHAVIPSLARDMTDPSEFNKMIDWAFVRLYHMSVFSSEVGVSGRCYVYLRAYRVRRVSYVRELCQPGGADILSSFARPPLTTRPFLVQISMELVSTPGYNAALNQAALWMLVISPLCVASPPCLLPISANCGAGPNSR
jgi:vesicular inhibitory amino acid transporter